MYTDIQKHKVYILVCFIVLYHEKGIPSIHLPSNTKRNPTMANKTERWVIPLIIVLLAFVGSLESASAHLSDSSSFFPSLNYDLNLDVSSGIQLTPVILLSPSNTDYGFSILEQSASMITAYSSAPKESGVFVSDTLEFSSVMKFLNFFSDFKMFQDKVFNAGKKILITTGADNIAESFMSLKSGSDYFLNVKPIKTAMDAEGYFAESGNYGVIAIGNAMDNNNKLFAVLFHELVHATQFNSNDPVGYVYNFMTENARDFSTEHLYGALNWVQSEIQAHITTANYINNFLQLPYNVRTTILNNLGLQASGLASERDSEMMKSGWYENEQSKILDELLKRNAKSIKQY